MISREEDGVWIVLREVIALHHEEVFACLTTADGLTRWFPVAAEIDTLAPGGVIRLYWDEKRTKSTTIAILNYDAGGMIVWDWYAQSSDTHAPVYWVVSPSVEQGSKVVLRQGPFKDDADSLIAMADEAESWRWQLCNLRSVLEAKHDMRKVRPL
ncbi:MAG TPA: SRPBCC domain-containing protein [Phycisphaerales bacterium]|nr:SRPBCC domain-containing protein [Phycisphaerales bacterium]